MKLHLAHTPKKSPFTIDHDSKILLAGSCFSDNIGNLLIEHRFNALVNPEGLFFNPASLCDSLKAIITNDRADENLLIKRDGKTVSFLHHSRVHAASEKEFITRLESKRKEIFEFLKDADVLILTFGTAFVYSLKESGHVVANCHKQPAQLFQKRILSVSEIGSMYNNLLTKLLTLNRKIRIIFTLSPVKYLKDGVEENNLSKATLRLAIEEILQVHSNCSYFPAYELINDDLRDYRFYKEDMAHPNEQAIQYVWTKFSDCFFTETTKKKNIVNAKEVQRQKHRPLHND